jgi:hypothetical protein
MNSQNNEPPHKYVVRLNIWINLIYFKMTEDHSGKSKHYY